ncbi:MAG: flagellar hook-associated protein FlgK, partial [Desulfobacterales bacterium]|nr:flagellar hook-associated protein FlgK [Desulfobacterales bacterium]
MSGLSSTLSIAKTAIAAQQYGLNVTGHNVSNVNNPDFSRQRADHISNTPAIYGGHLFGTGVNVSQVKRTVDTLLENRLTDEKSTQTALQEAESYMKVVEGYFDESSEASLNTSLGAFWNSWHDLSNSPLGASQRVQVYEQGAKLADRFTGLNSDLDQVSLEITKEVETTLGEINSIASRLADLNQQIIAMEGMGSANDLRDQQNGLVDQLAELINVDIISQGDGALIINVANGSTLVNGVHHNTLAMKDGQINWQGSFDVDITDDISGGKLGGWLVGRDEVIPKYKAQLNELSQEIMWNINKIHS